MSTERRKGCWRGMDPDEQIEAALKSVQVKLRFPHLQLRLKQQLLRSKDRMEIAHVEIPTSKSLFLHHVFRHSQTSIMSSSSWFLSGVMSFFILLKTRSHSVDITR